jgi:hypothetical protein
MPRQSQIKERSKFQFTDNYTFDYTTPNAKVVANTPNARMRAPEPFRVPMDHDLTVFSAIMNQINDILAGPGAAIHRQVQKERTERGKTDAAAKLDPQEDSDAYVFGYELLKGKSAAGELQQALDGHFEASKDEPDMVKFQQTQAQVVRKFLAGRSQAFIEGIMGDALGLEEKYQEHFLAYNKEKAKADVLGKLGEAAMVDINSIDENDAVEPETRAKAMREVITGAQEYGKPYSVDRTTVSNHLINLIGQKAVAEGKPSLLDWASLEDKDGVSVDKRPEFAAKIAQFRREAERSKLAITHEAHATRRNLENEKIDTIAMDLADAINDGDRVKVKAIGQQIMSLSDPNNPDRIQLQASRYRSLVHAYNKAMKPEKDGPEKSDPHSYKSYMVRAINGELTDEDIDTMDDVLSRGDVKSVIRRQLSASSRKEREERSAYNRLGKELLRKVSKSDGSLFSSEADSQKYYDCALMLDEEFTKYKAANKGSAPDRAATLQIHQDIEKRLGMKPAQGSTQGKAVDKPNETGSDSTRSRLNSLRKE